MGQNAPPPCLCADFRRRQVAAIGIVAGKAEGHGDDRDAVAVIEGVVVHIEPVAQAVAGAIPEWSSGFVDAQAWSLAGYQNPGGVSEPHDRSWAVPRVCGCEPLAADSAGGQVFSQSGKIGHLVGLGRIGCLVQRGGGPWGCAETAGDPGQDWADRQKQSVAKLKQPENTGQFCDAGEPAPARQGAPDFGKGVSARKKCPIRFADMEAFECRFAVEVVPGLDAFLRDINETDGVRALPCLVVADLGRAERAGAIIVDSKLGIRVWSLGHAWIDGATARLEQRGVSACRA